ncbi:MAG: ABC transporter ATP-binding protein [Chloroflexi bacterium]|nr:ABC transporter ATP-binding protein [Chloroflexota bacterium]
MLLVQALATLALPALNADIIDQGIAQGDNDRILVIGGVMLIVTLVMAVAAVLAVYWSARVAMGFGRDLRAAIFRTVETFSQVEVVRFGSASLITRNTNDVQQVQTLVFMALTIIITGPIMIVGGIIMALREDVALSALLLLILPAMAVVIGLTMVRAVPLFQAMQQRIDRINQVMRETLSGVRVIRAFVRTRHEEARFAVANQDVFLAGLGVNRLFAVTIPALTLIMNLASVAVLWFGAMRVMDGAMGIGNLTAFLQYVLQIMFSVLTAIMMFILVPRAAVSSGRIREVLETRPAITDPATPTVPAVDGPDRGVVELRDVTFRYPGAEEPVLTGISFRAERGATTAIVGSTGSGKTTLIDLIPRLTDASDGTVLVDGVDVRDQARPALWRRIGFVPQKAYLFSGSVASNLRYGDEAATDEQLWQALDVAQARDFVEAMDDGLGASIAQGGTNVSGGQRQRLAIARAIVHAPDIFVFDDSFSALDMATDARLRRALARELAHATVIIVAQRVGTIMDADRIVVLDAGRVVGVGTHEELLASNKTYREIVSSQLERTELAA